ncbi:MAG: redoxin domain-containing protein [Pseudomonadota bacterium]
MPTTPLPGQKAPDLVLPLIVGGEWDLHRQEPETFTMIVVYRSLHCPICKTYLATLRNLYESFLSKGIQAINVSMDSEDRARQAHEAWGLDPIPMAYGMSEATAREWGLFLSKRRKDSEPPIFAEPGLFLVTRDGTLWMIDVANVPFVRPDLKGLLDRADMLVENAGGPPRGGD